VNLSAEVRKTGKWIWGGRGGGKGIRNCSSACFIYNDSRARSPSRKFKFKL